MPKPLITTAVLDRRTLRRMAGTRSFERGEDYVANGQVGSLAEHEGTITTKVQGARSYRVTLWIENGGAPLSIRSGSTVNLVSTPIALLRGFAATEP